MSKTAISGWIHQPLMAVLSTRAKVAALEILWRAAAPIPYREVVRRTGMAYGSIDLALNDLVASGMVERIGGGRERLVRLRSGHRLAPPIVALLRAEADFFPALRVELRAVAEVSRADGLLSAAIIGPAATRTEALGEAMDVLVVARDAAGRNRILSRFDDASEGILSRFGVRLSPIAYDLKTARSMWNTRTKAAERTVCDAELLVGTPLEELLAGAHA